MCHQRILLPHSRYGDHESMGSASLILLTETAGFPSQHYLRYVVHRPFWSNPFITPHPVFARTVTALGRILLRYCASKY